MNERIRELADKIWEEKYWTNPNTDKLLPAQLNRFAELIVRECAEVASDPLSFTEAAYCRVGLLKHFGIQK